MSQQSTPTIFFHLTVRMVKHTRKRAKPLSIDQRFAEYKKHRKRVTKIPFNIDENLAMLSNHVALIVPYRDNALKELSPQLKVFVEHYHNYLSKTGAQLKIYIIEQSDDGNKFNRGKLLNIGFEIAKDEGATSFIFSDVDLISPHELTPLYATFPDHPIHIASLWKEKYNFGTYMGGIIAFNAVDYEIINGFPNNFWGWGGEDDSMYDRIAVNDIPIYSPISERAIEIKGLEHKPRDKSVTTLNVDKKKNILADIRNWRKNGLSNLDYKILNIEELKHENVNKYTVEL